jgi:hypothetical protein
MPLVFAGEAPTQPAFVLAIGPYFRGGFRLRWVWHDSLHVAVKSHFHFNKPLSHALLAQSADAAELKRASSARFGQARSQVIFGRTVRLDDLGWPNPVV